MSYRLAPNDMAAASHPGRFAWSRLQIPQEAGLGYADRMLVDEGFTIACSHYRPHGDLIEESVVERETDSLTITIGIDGWSAYRGRDGCEFTFQAGRTTVTAFHRARGERLYRAEENVRQLRLIVEGIALQRYGLAPVLDQARASGSASRILFVPSGAAMMRSASRLVRMHGEGGNPLDLHIAALSMLSQQVALMACTSDRAWTPDDAERISRARDILAEQYDRPITIGYLCAQVGTNEFKLKRGFHELFDTTPHRMLTEIRMRRALELLEEKTPISIVAYQVGFQHVSSFSAAFRHFYGSSPSALRLGRRS